MEKNEKGKPKTKWKIALKALNKYKRKETPNEMVHLSSLD